MKKKLIISLLLLLFLGINYSYACWCSWQGGLLKVSQQDSLTVHAKVNRYLSYVTYKRDNYTFPTAMEIEVVRVLKGKEERKLINVEGGNGVNCSPPVASFPIGSEWVLSLWKWKTEYSISNCGEHYAPIYGGMAVGYLIHNRQDAIKDAVVMSLDTLAIALANPRKYMMPTKWYRNDEDVYIEVEQMPRFSQQETILEYLARELKVKKDIRKRQPDVIGFNFIITEDGSLQAIRLNKDVLGYSPPMRRKYSRRIVKLLNSQKWIAGTHHGKPMKVYYWLEINIKDLLKK